MSRARDTADQINRVNSSAADATAITVDSSENVGIGTSSPVTFGANTHGLTLNGTASGQSITFQQGGENKGFIYNNTNDMIFASEQSGGSLTLGSNLRVSTGGSERIRIDSDGLKFHGDTAAASALDDYEEGTFALNNAGDGTGVVASTGKYVKIGRQVTVHAIANVTTNFTSQAMDGLPFAPSHVTTFSSIHGAAVCIGANVFAVNCNSGTTRVEFRNTSHAATAPTTGPIRFTMVYQTT
jgi:hypothetical protein